MSDFDADDALVSVYPGPMYTAWVLWKSRKPVECGVIDFDCQTESFYEFMEESCFNVPHERIGNAIMIRVKLVIDAAWGTKSRRDLSDIYTKANILTGFLAARARDCFFVAPYIWKPNICIDASKETVPDAVQILYPEFYETFKSTFHRDRVFNAVGVGHGVRCKGDFSHNGRF